MIKGNTEPRLYTPPLRKLTPKTSLGYMFIDFCESLEQPLLPWQKWLSIHILEIVGDLDGDWHFRFRYAVVLVARQNGKTFWFKLLGLFFNYVLQTKLVIGTGQSLDKSNDTFEEAVETIEESPMLSEEFEKALRGAGKREYIQAVFGAGAGHGLIGNLVAFLNLIEKAAEGRVGVVDVQDGVLHAVRTVIVAERAVRRFLRLCLL